MDCLLYTSVVLDNKVLSSDDNDVMSVSYTHLDVYKRQALHSVYVHIDYRQSHL